VNLHCLSVCIHLKHSINFSFLCTFLLGVCKVAKAAVSFVMPACLHGTTQIPQAASL
jgi:hypothetical protein